MRIVLWQPGALKLSFAPIDMEHIALLWPPPWWPSWYPNRIAATQMPLFKNKAWSSRGGGKLDTLTYRTQWENALNITLETEATAWGCVKRMFQPASKWITQNSAFKPSCLVVDSHNEWCRWATSFTPACSPLCCRQNSWCSFTSTFWYQTFH